jgi:hypothetical protein
MLLSSKDRSSVASSSGKNGFTKNPAQPSCSATPQNPPTSPAFLAGWQTVTHTVELVDSDNLSSSGRNEFFDLNGNSYRSGCSTAIGRRFE